MKIALLSDIHSNVIALKAVLQQVRQEGIEVLMIAGDFVGYYFDLRSVFEELSDFTLHCCQGNHDEQYLNFLLGNYNDKNNRYNYKNISQTKSDHDSLMFLKQLNPTNEVVIDKTRFLICHGSPWNRDSYVYPDTDLEKVGDYGCLSADIIIQGHSHYQMIKTIQGKLVVNPGSIGQPRSKWRNAESVKNKNVCGAQWAVFDTKTKIVSQLTTCYDGSALIEKCIAEVPENPFLHKVLLR